MNYTERKPTFEDTRELYLLMRPADVEEMEALLGEYPSLTYFWAVIQAQDEVYSVLAGNGAVVCLYGVCEGEVWLLGTQYLDLYMLSLCKRAKQIIELWTHHYGTLTNVTHTKNHRIIMWLRWLGFTFGPEEIINGQPFIRFSRSTHVYPGNGGRSDRAGRDHSGAIGAAV